MKKQRRFDQRIPRRGSGIEALERPGLRKLVADNLASLDGSASPTTSALLRARLTMIAEEREAVIALRDRNEISDTVMRRLQQEFDHEEVLLHQRYGIRD